MLLRLIPERWRWAHRRYARVHGYGWGSCPLCGRGFGGHQLRCINGKSFVIFRNPDELTTGTGICPECTRVGLGEREPGVICLCGDCERWRRKRGAARRDWEDEDAT